MFHLHPKIVKEDAFLGLDAVSSTRGQIELRVWFSVKYSLVFGKRRGGFQ